MARQTLKELHERHVYDRQQIRAERAKLQAAFEAKDGELAMEEHDLDERINELERFFAFEDMGKVGVREVST